MKIRLLTLLAVLAVFASSAAWAQKDFARSGPASPPVIDASEDTIVSYLGGEPAPVPGALDADDSTYNRVLTGCGGLSGVGTAVSWDTVTITNNSPGTASFVVFTSDVGSATCATIDTFLTAYTTTFNPAAPLTNCAAADDDLGVGNCSQIAFSIPVGETRVVVVTSFGNGALFPYQVNFTGTTPVELLHFSVDSN
ncbi:MAG: hypothetical protein ABI689_10295 [Thermoanaerobaculia bacterium]